MYDYVPGKAAWFAADLPGEGAANRRSWGGALAHRDVATCPPDATIRDVAARMGGWEVCVVIDDRAVVLGAVRRETLGLPDDTAVENVLQPGPPTVRPDIPARELLQSMRDDGQEHVLVTTNEGVLLGLVRTEDLRGEL